MKNIFVIVFLLYWSIVGFSQSIPHHKLYFGQAPPGAAPVIFAPGFVSLTERRETKIVFSPSGTECMVGVGETGTFKILYSKYENGMWSELKPMEFNINNRIQEPFFSPDGKRIFFTSFADIYMVNREGQTRTLPVRLSLPVNTTAEEYHPTVTPNGTLYFCSMRDNNNPDLYRAKLENGSYSVVEKLDKIIHLPYHAWDPFIAPDESYIIFTSIYPGGFGKEDQYISYNINGRWTNPKNLGPKINTNKIEYGSYVSPDNKYYFFSRPEGWGTNIPADIYWVSASFIDNLKHTNFVPYLNYQLANQSSAVGRLFSYSIPENTFFDDDGNNTLTYSATLNNGDALPAWLSFNASNQTFSGTPINEGTYSIKVSVADNAKAEVNCIFNVNVINTNGTEKPGK